MSGMLLAVLVVGPIAFLLMAHSWRVTFFAAIIVAILEGAIRKWVLPGASNFVYFLKDAMLLAVFFGCFKQKTRQFVTPAAKFVASGFILCFLFGLLQALNPASPSFLLYLIGLKSYFIYVPIAFVVPHLFRDLDMMLRFIHHFVVFSIPIAILGFVQLWAGPTHWISVYVSHSDEVAHVSRFGEEALGRTSGTFSYIGGFTTYLTFICSLCVAYLARNDFRLKNSRVILVSFTLCFAATFTTGSRGPIVLLALLIMCSTIYGAARGLLTPLTFLRIIVLLPITAFIGMKLVPEAVEGLAYRASNSDSNWFRLIGPFYQAWAVFDLVPIFGFGLGSTHNSSLVVMNASEHWWLHGVNPESETARILVEMGHIGFFMFYGFLVLSISKSVSPLFRMRSRTDALFGLIFMTFLPMMILSPFVNNPMAGIYFWMSIGLLHAYHYYATRRTYRGPAVPSPGGGADFAPVAARPNAAVPHSPYSQPLARDAASGRTFHRSASFGKAE